MSNFKRLKHIVALLLIATLTVSLVPVYAKGENPVQAEFYIDPQNGSDSNSVK